MKRLSKYYPIAVKLKDKSALVVGGGKVSERKVRSLLVVGARVCVVSPVLTRSLQRLAKNRKITWFKKTVQYSDLRQTDIVVAATSSAGINRKISQWAKRRGVLINAVDQPQLSNFISPAVFRTTKATVAVYTNGKDPVLSRDLKNFLKEHWDVFLSYRNQL